MKKLRIIIDAYQYTPIITGTDRMAHNFLEHLQSIDITNHYYVICSERDYVPGVIHAPNFTVIRPPALPGPSSLKRLLYKAWRTLVYNGIILLRADTYISFHNLRAPKFRVAKKIIVSDLDLIPLVLDEYKKLGRLKESQVRASFQAAADRADAFMSISEFSKRELVLLLRIEPAKVEVIYLAPDNKFTDKPDRDGVFLKTLPKSFLLTLGGSEPRKNVKTVVAAYSLLPPDLQARFPLLIVGGEWHGIPLEQLQLNDNIQLLGYVDEDALAALYRNSTAFIFASRYEGFGFTILEAMASGTAVISSNSSSLAEVAGQAALLFDPEDIKMLGSHIESVLAEPQLREKLIGLGKQQAEKFTWETSAEKLYALLTL